MIPYRLQRFLSAAQRGLSDLALSFVTTKLPLPASVRDKKVTFIGASVADAWRIHLVFPRIQTVAVYAFDKSAAIEKALQDKPAAIILKECAAYFPDDPPSMANKQELLTRWVDQVIAAAVRPILATCVPVTRAHAEAHPGRAEGIWEFNDFLYRLADERDIPLLDLERATRISREARYLRDGLDNGDGLHLRRETYRQLLDHLVPPALIRALSES